MFLKSGFPSFPKPSSVVRQGLPIPLQSVETSITLPSTFSLAPMLQSIQNYDYQAAKDRLRALTFGIVFFVLPLRSGLSQFPVNQRTDATISSARESGLILDVIGPDLNFELEENHSKLIRTAKPVLRASIVDPTIVEITQFDTKNLEIIGLKAGFTDMTLWFGDANNAGDLEVLRYRVRVSASNDSKQQRQMEYDELESTINELFPNSSVEIILVENMVIVRGQARDVEEAANIMSLIRRQAYTLRYGQRFNAAVPSGNFATGQAGPGYNNSSYGGNIVNLLRVPGEQQVLLKVRVVELTRSARREIGLDFSVNSGGTSVSSTLGNTGNLLALLDGDEVSLMLRAVSSNAYSKILAEPNLVTLSGRTASFIAGGQFAVPTTVGVGGAQAATTFFQGFGTQVQFTPTVLDKDRIRLRVAPTMSSINAGNTVNGIPGLNTRSVFTTVDMREGQWLAIAGLIENEQRGSKLRVPGLGDVPIGGTLFGRNLVQRDETEMLILVSPQLVHPLDAESVPSILPGMDIGEPNNREFFIENQIESLSRGDYRSTSPLVPNDAAQPYQNQRMSRGYRAGQDYYLCSPYGFSE